MNETRPLDETAFRQALTPAYVRQLRLVHLALVMGAAMMLALLIGLYVSNVGSSNEGTGDMGSILSILSLLHAAVALSVYVVASVLQNALLSPPTLEKFRARSPSMPPAELALQLIQRALILRVVLYEGVALLGRIVCILGVIFGVLRPQPIYWLNVVTTFILFAHVAANFPSEERLVRIFSDRLASGH